MDHNFKEFVNLQIRDLLIKPLPDFPSVLCGEEELGCSEAKITIRRRRSLVQEGRDVVRLLIEFRESVPLNNTVKLNVRTHENNSIGSQLRTVTLDASIEFWCLDVPAYESVYLALK